MKKDFFYKKYSNYLPSRKFTIIFIIFVFLAGIFMLFFSSSSKENFVIRETGNNVALKIENQTINDLMQKDSDGDGISDWEEALWGTDKNKIRTFDNISDATYIENKKKELNIEQSVNVSKLTETEKFAREFFTSFSAMKESGQVDQDTINSFSNALGQKIVNPALVDRYNETDVKIDISDNGNNPTQKQKYYDAVKKLFESYAVSGIGDELDIVNNGLASSGTTSNADPYRKLSVIANAYQDFAKKLMEIKIPGELTIYHLQIANSSNNTGISVANMKEIVNDPLVGLQGLSQYQKYSEDLTKAVADLETVLSQ
jgi:hypothetical protein